MLLQASSEPLLISILKALSLEAIAVIPAVSDRVIAAAVQTAVKGKVRACKLRMRSLDGTDEEVTFELRIRSKNEAALVDAVKACTGVESVNLVSYSGETIG